LCPGSPRDYLYFLFKHFSFAAKSEGTIPQFVDGVNGVAPKTDSDFVCPYFFG
jgi:hypothetical protein